MQKIIFWKLDASRALRIILGHHNRLVGSFLLVIFMQACDSRASVVSNKDILTPISEEQLLNLANRAPPDQRESKLSALRAALDKSKSISDAPVAIELDGVRYEVPMNYLTPWGDFHARNNVSTFGVHVFLPDYRGYDRKNFIVPDDVNEITLKVWGKTGSGRPEVNVGLDRLSELGSLKPIPRLNRYGLVAYELRGDSGLYFVGTGDHGIKIWIGCTLNADFGICQVDYHHAQNGYWFVYEYNYVHLSQWREIDAALNGLLLRWSIAG